MKKSKVILAIVLAVVLLITVISAPTFSWFTRSTADRTHEGNSMVLKTKNSYKAYNGYNVSLSTSKSTNGGESYTVSCDNTGEDNAKVASGTISDAGGRDFYCTTITNNSGIEQNVSLYTNNLTSNSVGFSLGVNGPTRNIRDFTLMSNVATTEANTNSMRVYFQRPSDNYVNNVDWHTGNYWVHCWRTGETGEWLPMSDTGDHSNYYVDIPSTSTNLYFYIGGYGEDGSNRTVEVDLVASYQSQSHSQCYVAYNETYGEYSHVNIGTYSESSYAPNVITYYDTITIAPGVSFDASLRSGMWTGKRAEYYTDPSTVCSVDSSTGVITALTEGTATLYSKAVGGTYGDSYQVETTITVADSDSNSYTDVPIVRNIKVPADDNSTDTAENVVKVYWYVKRTGASSLTYSIDQVYLGM